MARRSTRNLILAFRAAEVDDQSIGPDVSEDVQLVYVVDNISESTESHAGVGGSEGAVLGEHGIISIQARNPRGLIIEAAQMVQSVFFGNETTQLAWTADTVVAITAPGTPLTMLQSGPTPQAGISQGTIPTATIAVGAFRSVNNSSEGLRGFFLEQGRFMFLVHPVANVATEFGLRWRELSRS